MWRKILAWLPAPLLLLTMLWLWAANPRISYESNFVVMVLNFLFSTLASLFIAYLIGRSFLVRSSPGLLLLGCGVLTWGAAGVVANAASGGQANLDVTIHNSGVWLSALFHLAGAVLLLRPGRPVRAAGLWLSAGYVIAPGAVVLVAMAAIHGHTPTFFVQGEGGTLLRQFVLGSAIVMFLLAAVLIRISRREDSSGFSFWYIPAMVAIAMGLLGILLQSTIGGLLPWGGRTAMALSGVYMLLAALASVRESNIWGIPLEEALRSRENFISGILGSITDAFMCLDKELRYTFANEEMLRRLGKSLPDLLGRNTWDVYPEAVGNAAYVALHRAMAERISLEYELFYEPFQAYYAEKVYPTPGGGLAIFSRDITDRKRAEQQLKQLNDTLEKRVAERTAEAEARAEQLRALAARLTQTEQKERQRLATILHDHLQQLLVGTKFHLGVLRSQLPTPQQRDSLQQVDDLLDESLDASRNLTVDLCPPILQQGTMPQVLRWLGDWFGLKHGLAVDVQAEEQANPPAQEIRVLLFQAVRELLLNVVKYAKVKQVCVELSCAPDGQIRAIVSDAGVGFDPAQSSVSKHDGGGFGLFSIRERLDWLGGNLEIQSAPGQGTRATLIAPMQLKTRPADGPVGLEIAQPSGTPTPVAPTGAPARGIRVLLADDHVVMRDGLSRLLQTQPDMEVVGQAADGLQVVDLARQLQPHVVIMDINMPHMDGVEATRQIKAHDTKIQVIGLSMFTEMSVAEGMKAAGASDYLAKTSGPDALIAAIRECAGVAEDSHT